MKRTLSVIFLGLLAGVVAHVAWLSALRLPNPNDREVQIAWMKNNLHLTDSQAQQIRALHDRSAPRLTALALEVASMQAELAAFERVRRSEGRIDFLEFARFVEYQRRLDEECARSREQLVTAASQVMTADQRETYFKLLDPALKTGRADALN